MGTKFTLALLAPVWLVVAVGLAWSRGWRLGALNWRAGALSAAVPALALLVLNALYVFQGTFSPLGSHTFTSPLLSGSPDAGAGDFVGNRFAGTAMGRIPVPLPADFLLGFDSQLDDQQVGKFASLSGGRLVDRGPWYSPLRTMLYKLPGGTLLLLAAALGYWLWNPRRVTAAEALVWVTPLTLLGFLCTQPGGLNSVYRYTLPAAPFLLIGAGKLVEAAWRHRAGRVVVAACFLWNVAAVVSVRPGYLSFGNELAGGPDGAQRMFVGSNYDWGQDLFRLRRWAHGHPDLRPLAVVYHGVIEPSEVGLETCLPPASFFTRPAEVPDTGPRGDFYLAVSSNGLHGLPCHIDGGGGFCAMGIIRSPLLRPENAIARVGRSIYVFRVEAAGGTPGPTGLSAAAMAGCVREVEADDVTGVP